jgi:periplasmic protein TonB
MGVASNASAISASQCKYVGMFRDVLTRYSVSFGKAADFAQLVPKLMRSDQFRVEFSMLVEWIQREEEGHLTLNEMVTILWITMTDSKGDGLGNPSCGPLMILLSGLGGWPQTEADRETSVKSAPTSSASEAGIFRSVDYKEEKREAQDAAEEWAAAARRRRRLMAALWLLPILPLLLLCVVLYRGYVRRGAMPSEAVTNAASTADATGKSSRGRSSRAGPRRQLGVEDSGEGAAASGPGEQAIEAPPASIVVYGDKGPIRFDQAGRLMQSQVTAPAMIHTPNSEPPPPISGGGDGMPAVVPEAVVTMSYPAVEAREVSSATLNRRRPGSAGTESRTSIVTPVVVASATAPPVASVARPNGGSSAIKGLPAQRFDLLHPRVSVSDGLRSAEIVKFQMPSYPKSARKQRLQGDVLVRVLISEKGKIVRAVALNGPQSLRESAEKAVSHWRYTPSMENGKPVVAQTWVTFHFELREG